MTVTTSDKLAYGPDEAAHLFNIGRTTLYRLIRDGELRTVKVGRRRLIPATELHRFLGND